MDEKLEGFIKLAISEAVAKRDSIISEAEKYKKECLMKAEDECLEKSYVIVQKGVNESRKNYDFLISQRPSECKRELFEYREKLINLLFEELLKKIYDFKNSSSYTDFLVNKVSEAINALGDGQKIILIDKTDEKYIGVLSEKFDCEVAFSENIIGGAVVKNLTAKKIFNNSLSEKISDLRSDFLKDTKFSIY